MSEPDALAAELWRRQHEAEDALVHGDVGPRLALWSHRAPVTLFAALGPSKSGWAVLEPMFRPVASRLSDGQKLSYELIAFDTAGEIAWTVINARSVERLGLGHVIAEDDLTPERLREGYGRCSMS